MNMREIQKMQQKLVKMQEELEVTEFSGTAGGGAVQITMNGKYEITAVKIDSEVIGVDEIADLEVMVVAAARAAHEKVSDAQQKMATNVTGGLRIPGLF